MADDNEFMKRRRAQLAAEAAKGSGKPDSSVETTLPPAAEPSGIPDERSDRSGVTPLRRPTNRPAPAFGGDGGDSLAKSLLRSAVGAGHSEAEIRNMMRDASATLREARGIFYRGELISEEVRKKLDAIVRSAIIKSGSDSAYLDAVRTVKEWTPEQIVNFIMGNVDGHLRSRPALARALLERAEYCLLFDGI